MGTPLGEMHAASFEVDPKHLGFVLARYYFVARMLHGKGRVLEIGSGDGTGARLVRETVGSLTTTDLHNLAADLLWDMTRGPMDGVPVYDAAYALDVLEHIEPNQENDFIRNICCSLVSWGTLIIGMPSLESQPYASELSKLHHVNCKTEDQLREVLLRHFYNVFLFGMNDSSLHTGYGPMCHYRLAICTGKR